MRELIPSKNVRNYLQKLGRKFNNFECATLIYNSDWSLTQMACEKYIERYEGSQLSHSS